MSDPNQLDYRTPEPRKSPGVRSWFVIILLIVTPVILFALILLLISMGFYSGG